MSPNARSNAYALSLFAALTVPFGIVAHLASEFGALGWTDDQHLAFSPLHAYLAAIAVAAVAFLACAVAGFRANRKAAIADLIDALPFQGAGYRFVALSFAFQFAFFAVTQLAEGCPFCDGDLFTGLVAAALASLAGAIAIVFGKRRILESLRALVAFCALAPRSNVVPFAIERPVRTPRRRGAALTYLANRPPPAALPA